LSELGVSSLLTKHNFSPSLLLSSMYPDYDWLPWQFDKCPQNYWDSIDHRRKFMEWAGKQLNVKEMEDWYRVSVKVQEIGRFSI
jgi:hypothetical protein